MIHWHTLNVVGGLLLELSRHVEVFAVIRGAWRPAWLALDNLLGETETENDAMRCHWVASANQQATAGTRKRTRHAACVARYNRRELRKKWGKSGNQARVKSRVANRLWATALLSTKRRPVDPKKTTKRHHKIFLAPSLILPRTCPGYSRLLPTQAPKTVL